MISRLTLSDFRNYADALIVPQSRFIALTGENGAGKTNILEAISLLSPGRGLRGAKVQDMARQVGPGIFGIAARVDGVTIGTGTSPDHPERRVVRIDGTNAAATSLAERLSVLWLTPAMDRLFLDSPGGRRRFLDRMTMALHPGHAIHSSRYEAAMRARNKLLENGLARADANWLNALEAQMAQHGMALDEARRDLVDALNRRVELEPDEPFARPVIALEGWSAPDEGAFAAQLREGRGRDAAAHRALNGPHRNELAVTHASKGQAAALCSTGEQKALLLSIMLAHAMLVAQQVGRPPVILLDEVTAHLDPVRREALFDRLDSTGAQIWMTGTDEELFAGIVGSSQFHVESGTCFQLVPPHDAPR